MDEQEILSRLDARGRAAAAGAHHAVADTPVPAFDPDAHPVTITATSVRRWSRRRAVALAGVAALALAVVAVVTLGSDGDNGTADRVGTVEPARRFVAGHLPDGYSVAGVSDPSSETDDREPPSGPLVLYGPTPDRPELAVAVATTMEAPSVDDEGDGTEVVAAGDRQLRLMPFAGLAPHVGTVEVDGRSVLVMARDRETIEAVAAAVEVDDGARPVVPPGSLPDGWAAQGELDSVESAYGVIAALRLGYPPEGGAVVAYGRDPETLLSVMSRPGGPVDVAAVRLFSSSWEDVEVRGRPAVLSLVDDDQLSGIGSVWAVTWEERPGEVVTVSGFGAAREDILAVAEGLEVADQDTWDELIRESLRSTLMADDAVLLGEGTFRDGSPWVLLVHEMFEGTETDPDGGGSMGGAVPGGEAPGDGGPASSRSGHLQVRTTMGSTTGAAIASGPGRSPDQVFRDGISLTGGGGTAWTYALVAPEVATVELVGVDGEVLVTAEVLSAEGYHGFLIELPPELAELPGLVGPSGGGAPTTIVVGRAAEGEELPVSPAGPSTSAAEASPPFDDLSSDRPVLVARAADGTELGRQPLP